MCTLLVHKAGYIAVFLTGKQDPVKILSKIIKKYLKTCLCVLNTVSLHYLQSDCCILKRFPKDPYINLGEQKRFEVKVSIFRVLSIFSNEQDPLRYGLLVSLDPITKVH